MKNRRNAAGTEKQDSTVPTEFKSANCTSGTEEYTEGMTDTDSSETSATHPSNTSYGISRLSTLSESMMHDVETNLVTPKDRVWLEAVREYLIKEPMYRTPFKKVKVVRKLNVQKKSKTTFRQAFRRYIDRKLVDEMLASGFEEMVLDEKKN